MGQFKTKNQQTNFKTNQFKMAFYIYGEPVFATEHFHPGFFQSSRSMIRPKHWNLLEDLFDPEETACQYSQSCCSSTSAKKSVEKSSTSSTDQSIMDREISKTDEENKDLQPVSKSISKRFMSKV